MNIVSGDHEAERLLAASRKVARELALDGALAELTSALNRRGVRTLLLKGPALATWLYDDATERPYGDIDLLVVPDRFDAAALCMAELGFERRETGQHPHEQAAYHDAWVSARGYPIVVELHRTLPLLSAPPANVWRRLTANADSIELTGTRIEIPCAAARALIVGLHAAQHGRASHTPICDLERALSRADAAVWRQAVALARELGGLAALSEGLRLTPNGRDLARALGISAERPAISVRLRAGSAPDTALGVERLITTPGVAGRLALIARELAPSRGFMRACYPLARRGRLGLSAAYLVRPVALLLKLPRGIAAWARVAVVARRERQP